MLIDTTVISELAKPTARIDPSVRRWAAQMDPGRAHISVITVEEIWLGILRLARRDRSRPRPAAPG